MRANRVRCIYGMVLLAWLPASLHASDPPHWAGFSQEIDCMTACHTTHSVLSGAAANINICQSCHNAAGMASALPINSANMAVPGVSGTSHAFDVAAINSDLDTQLPLDPPMQARVIDGNIVCSTCHNQHTSTAAFGGTLRISAPKMVAGTVDAGDGMLAAGGSYSGTESAWFVLRVNQAGTETTARFQHQQFTDSGGWTPWSDETAAGADIPLADGITATFRPGAYELNDVWELYVAWPFLRAALDGATGAGSMMCQDCHRQWVMSFPEVESSDGSYMSHPVAVALNANSRSYDRAVPLDANGAEQGSGGADANPDNDLHLDGLGNVHCLSCHDVHYADSNAQTVAAP